MIEDNRQVYGYEGPIENNYGTVNYEPPISEEMWLTCPIFTGMVQDGVAKDDVYNFTYRKIQ